MPIYALKLNNLMIAKPFLYLSSIYKTCNCLISLKYFKWNLNINGLNMRLNFAVFSRIFLIFLNRTLLSISQTFIIYFRFILELIKSITTWKSLLNKKILQEIIFSKSIKLIKKLNSQHELSLQFLISLK